ncbi:hypothetical protein ACA910_002635 [Epithemia clementina (nom. ined.)]
MVVLPSNKPMLLRRLALLIALSLHYYKNEAGNIVNAWQPPGRITGCAHRSPLFSLSPTRIVTSSSTITSTSFRRHQPCLLRRVLSSVIILKSHANGANGARTLGKSSKQQNKKDDNDDDNDKLTLVDDAEQQQQSRENRNSSYLDLEEEELSKDDLRYRMEQLEQENLVLLETVNRLEQENIVLSRKAALASAALEQPRIVLEAFEGEGEEWCDSLEGGACPLEPRVSFWQALRERAIWLIGLLLLQSFSGIILSRNEALIANHPVIVYFLTMLVGAGGNAGNQASVRVIRGLALNTLNPNTQGQFLLRELKMAISLSTLLTLAGFIRAVAFATPLPETLAITSALFLIVFSSICLGAVLPLGLKRMGIDPAHSSTSIQVLMDILGVLLAVGVSNLLLDSPLGMFIVSKLIGS